MKRCTARMLVTGGSIFALAFCGCVAGPTKGTLEQKQDSLWSSANARPSMNAQRPSQASGLLQASFVEPQSPEVKSAGALPSQLPSKGLGAKDSTKPATAGELLPAPRSLPSVGMPAIDGPPVTLDDLIASVDTHYPLLLASLQDQGITSGQLLTAQGAFDLNLRAREFWQVGTYDSNRVSVGVDQSTDWNGISYFAGYRHSVGDFPIYYGDRKTGDGGEFRAGILIPLLAGRAIDKRRATREQAAITRSIVDPAIAAQRLDFVRAASRAYWTWVAVGRRQQIAREVLKIAEDRDKQLAELVQRGALAEIERTDNQRVIVERQARLISAERAWQQASIALSLYLRNQAGEPEIPSAARLPRVVADPQPFERSRLNQDIDLALQQRPELERLRLLRQRAAVDLELARNQTMPSINLGLEGYQDVGYSSAFSKSPLVKGTQLDRTAYLASLQLDFPLQQRDAKGRIISAQAAIAQLSFQEKFQRDRVVAEIQDAASALERSYELLNKARENVTVARKVESGERERFTKGQGTIVILNLRELVAAEASFAEVDAMAEYYRSLADYRAALGQQAPARVGSIQVVPGAGDPMPR